MPSRRSLQDPCSTEVARIVTGAKQAETIAAMELTKAQLFFLADLRLGALRAVAALDACVIGPLIRANLVRWDDDPADVAMRRQPRRTTFALTSLGARYLAEHEACRRLME